MNQFMLSLAVAGSAAAQQITGLPQLLQNPRLIAAVNTNDAEYKLCSAANQYLELCITQVGGTAAISTAAPTDLLGCVCCADGTALSEAFLTCSSYLSEEEPSLSTEYEAYGNLYALCSQTSCGRGSSRPSTTAASGSAESEPTGSATAGDDETLTTSIRAGTSGSATGSARRSSITQSATLEIPDACNDMVGLYQSCLRKDAQFSNMPFKEQASCYCCRPNSGTLSWTDALDGYAQTCRDWAETAESGTFYSVASTFATFCDKFSNACSGTVPPESVTSEPPNTTAPPDSLPTSGDDDDGSNAQDNGNDSSGSGTVTVTVPGSGSVIRAGCAAGLAAVVGAVLLL